MKLAAFVPFLMRPWSRMIKPRAPTVAATSTSAASSVLPPPPTTTMPQLSCTNPVASVSSQNNIVFLEDDDESLFNMPSFALSPDMLMTRARHVLATGIGRTDGGECLAENFEFCAAVIGPLGKREYMASMAAFDLEAALEITPNFFGMSVDPMQPNRVWFFNRIRALHNRGNLLGAEPTGNEIVYPPQTLHLDFDEQGKVTEFGFYTVDRRQGNTGGLGGAFGFFYGVGKPLPIRECQPYRPSPRLKMVNALGKLARKRP